MEQTAYRAGDCRRYLLPKGPGLKSNVLKETDEIRLYYITSVGWYEEGDEVPGIYQEGCGLNLEEDFATLCTCKRPMLETIHRHWKHHYSQRALYIAALAGKKVPRPREGWPRLVFLGKVSQSLDSFEELWQQLPPNVRAKKNAIENSLGDVYPPEIETMFKENHIAIEEYLNQKRKKRDPDKPAVIERLNANLKGHSHFGDEEYLEDLACAKPIVFDEWRAWPDGTAQVQIGNISNAKHRNKLMWFLKSGRPAPYGIRVDGSDIAILPPIAS